MDVDVHLWHLWQGQGQFYGVKHTRWQRYAAHRAASSKQRYVRLGFSPIYAVNSNPNEPYGASVSSQRNFSETQTLAQGASIVRTLTIRFEMKQRPENERWRERDRDMRGDEEEEEEEEANNSFSIGKSQIFRSAVE